MRHLCVAIAVGAVLLISSGCGSQGPTSPVGSTDETVGALPTDQMPEGTRRPTAGCTISSIASGTWYSQNNPSWSSILLGNSSADTIGPYGCVVTSLATVYHNRWSMPTTPAQLNASAVASGCFGPGSSLVTVSCAINSRGGPHIVNDIAMSDVASAICGGSPVMVDVTWGGGHKMIVYSYNGGSTTSLGSYTVIDPWNGTSKSLSSYTATRWRKLQ